MLTLAPFTAEAPVLPYTALRLGKLPNKTYKFAAAPKPGAPPALGIQFSLKPLSDKGYFTLFFFRLFDAKGNNYKIDVALKDGYLFLALHNVSGSTALTRISSKKLSLFEWNTITLNWNKNITKNWSFIVNDVPETKLSRDIELELGVPDCLELTFGVFNEDIALLGNIIVTDAPIVMPLNDPQTYRQHAYINLTSVADAVDAPEAASVLDPWFFVGMDQLSQIVGSFDCAASGPFALDLIANAFTNGVSFSVTWVNSANGARVRRFIYADSPILAGPIEFLDIKELVPKRFQIEVWLNPGNTKAVVASATEFVTSRAVTVRPLVLNPFATVII